jgi:hypothetical protein
MIVLMHVLNKDFKTILWIHSYVGYSLLGFKNWQAVLKISRNLFNCIIKSPVKENDIEFKGVDYSFVVKLFLVC